MKTFDSRVRRTCRLVGHRRWEWKKEVLGLSSWAGVSTIYSDWEKSRFGNRELRCLFSHVKFETSIRYPRRDSQIGNRLHESGFQRRIRVGEIYLWFSSRWMALKPWDWIKFWGDTALGAKGVTEPGVQRLSRDGYPKGKRLMTQAWLLAWLSLLFWCYNVIN